MPLKHIKKGTGEHKKKAVQNICCTVAFQLYNFDKSWGEIYSCLVLKQEKDAKALLAGQQQGLGREW